MKKYVIANIILFFSLWIPFSSILAYDLKAPNGNLKLKVELNENGEPYYRLDYKQKHVIEDSKLGFILRPNLVWNKQMEILNVDTTSFSETWKPVWGENASINSEYKELSITLKQKKTNWKMIIRFRLFDDGLGFRYEFPIQEGLRHFIIENELTEFNLTGDHKAFWMPADYDTNEFPITISKLSEVSSLITGVREEPLAAKSPSAELAVQTPLMLKSDDGLYINIHEASLVNYSALFLGLDEETLNLSAHLAPDAKGNKVYIQTGNHTPWRTIIVSDDARDILASNTILNLNEPSKIEDTSWIKPTKYLGVWWEYFTGGKSTWAYSNNQDVQIGVTDFSKLEPNGTHAANTEHVKDYIDFAAKHGFDAVLVEGWNIGWEDNSAFVKEKIYSFTEAYPDFNVAQLRDYAKNKGAHIIMHHETTSSVADYEKQIPDAFQFMNDNNYLAVKTGYVGHIIPRGEHHDGQWMVNHYNYVAEQAAKHKIMVNSHEAVRPTGLSRTYPNWIAQESARGTEFESFNGIAPNHVTILPFTRLMGGPMDYTPGIFEGDLSYYGGTKNNKLSSTLVKQLALYVTMYSPLQMAADLKENYERFPDAFQFIKDVAVDWDNSYILEAEPGEYITIARKAKNKDEWFIGGVTNENKRTALIDFSFLPQGLKYEAIIYQDAKNAHWQTNPKAYEIKKITVTSKTKLKQYLAPSGGVAISIKVK